MKISRQKDILYKRAKFLQPTGKTLQEHLIGAWSTLQFASEREQILGDDNENIRVWNRRVNRGLLTCGMFHSWEKGRSQLIVQVKDKVKEYAVVATDAPKVAGAKETEFNEGLLFFGVHKNHALVLQSSSLRVGALNEYLNWLLQDATSEIGKDNRVELDDELPRKLKRDAPPLKSIVLNPPMHAPVPTQQVAQHGPAKEVKMRLQKADWGWLRTALRGMSANVPDDLEIDKEFNADRLQIHIELRWTGRDKEREETPVLDSILRAFRDVDDPPIKAITATGEEIDGNHLRLKKKHSIQIDGGIPVPGDVFEKMQAYLTELLQRRDVSAD